MNNAPCLSLPGSVTDVRCRLDLWRRTRAKRGPIPAPLWTEMADLARLHGINPIARALRLDYYSLKRQVELTRRIQAPAGPAFVEVSVVPPVPSPECAVELERPDGARMSVRLSRHEDLVALSESFWRCRA